MRKQATTSAPVRSWTIRVNADFGRTILTPQAEGEYLDYWVGALRSDLTRHFVEAEVCNVGIFAAAAKGWYAGAQQRGRRPSERSLSLTNFEILLYAEPSQGGEPIAQINVLTGTYGVR